MDLKLRLQRMLQIVEESEQVGALADIERDILLAELREAYAELKFGKTENGEWKTENEEVAEEQVAESAEESAVELPIAPITPTEEEQEEESDEPEIEVELIFNEEEASSEELVESSEELEDVAETPNAPTPKRSALLSLYEDESTPIVGEQFHEQPSVADTIACPKGVAESAPVVSLREAIGIADKFMLIRELFDGNSEEYDKAIATLDNQPSFDDCIIYISENYTWSPNAQATKFVMDLLQRKYK